MAKKDEPKKKLKALKGAPVATALPFLRSAWVALRGDDGNYPGDAMTTLGVKQIAANADAKVTTTGAATSGELTAFLVAADQFTRTATGWDPNTRKLNGSKFGKDRPKNAFSGRRAMRTATELVVGKMVHKVATSKKVNAKLKKLQKNTIGPILPGKKYLEL